MHVKLKRFMLNSVAILLQPKTVERIGLVSFNTNWRNIIMMLASMANAHPQ